MIGLVVLFVGSLAVTASLVTERFDRRLTRIGDPFVADRKRPSGNNGAVNILAIGSDSRTSDGDARRWSYGAQRADTIMIVHIPADREGIQVVSIPRDSWVPIPGHDSGKINAAYSLGGSKLLIRTVEQLTRVRIDHIMITDFTGFEKVTDALGGVVIDVGASTPSAGSPNAGARRLDGRLARAYVRERHALPGGDFDRMRRQQNWMRAMAHQLISASALTNPVKLSRTMDAIADNTAVDDGLTMRRMTQLTLSLHSVRADDLHFATTPVTGTATGPYGQSIVNLAPRQGHELFSALADDTAGAWFHKHADEQLGKRVD